MPESTTENAEEVKLYSVVSLTTSPTAQNSGIPTMDRQEREDAEVLRALAEDREPDSENAPPTAGTPLKPLSHLVDAAISSNPKLLEALEKGLETEPEATVPIPKTEEEVAAEEEKPAPAATKTTTASKPANSS